MGDLLRKMLRINYDQRTIKEIEAVAEGAAQMQEQHARDVLSMATRSGARTLGLDADVGSLEPGKCADVIVVDRDRPHLAPGPDPYSTLVYAARGSDVRTTIVDGALLVDEFTPVRVDPAEIAHEARTAARELASNAGVRL